jgi:hypothetical protein
MFGCIMQGGTDTVPAVYDPLYSLFFLSTGPYNSVNSIAVQDPLSMSRLNI